MIICIYNIRSLLVYNLLKAKTMCFSSLQCLSWCFVYMRCSKVFVVYLLYIVLEKLLIIFIISHIQLFDDPRVEVSEDLVFVTVCLSVNIGQSLLYAHCKSCNFLSFLCILIIRKCRAM